MAVSFPVSISLKISQLMAVSSPVSISLKISQWMAVSFPVSISLKISQWMTVSFPVSILLKISQWMAVSFPVSISLKKYHSEWQFHFLFLTGLSSPANITMSLCFPVLWCLSSHWKSYNKNQYWYNCWLIWLGLGLARQVGHTFETILKVQ